jgi:hypothetical protein
MTCHLTCGNIQWIRKNINYRTSFLKKATGNVFVVISIILKGTIRILLQEKKPLEASQLGAIKVAFLLFNINWK